MKISVFCIILAVSFLAVSAVRHLEREKFGGSNEENIDDEVIVAMAPSFKQPTVNHGENFWQSFIINA